MKTPFLRQALLALVLTGTPAFAGMKYVVKEDLSEFNTLTWVSQYYQNPQPELLARRVHILSQMGYFEEEGRRAEAIGFFASIFAQNPQRVHRWVSEFRSLPVQHQKILASALWLSGSSHAEGYLNELMAKTGSVAALDLLNSTPRALADLPVESKDAMAMQWGAYVASGDARHVTRILAAVGSQTPGISETARFSLALRASQDARVREICRNELTRQPQEIQEVLRAAFNEASTTPSS